MNLKNFSHTFRLFAFYHGRTELISGNNSRNTSLSFSFGKFSHFFIRRIDNWRSSLSYLPANSTQNKDSYRFSANFMNYEKETTLNRYQFQSGDFTIITRLFLERNRAALLVVNVRWKSLSSMTCLAIDLWQHQLSRSRNLICTFALPQVSLHLFLFFLLFLISFMNFFLRSFNSSSLFRFYQNLSLPETPAPDRLINCTLASTSPR